MVVDAKDKVEYFFLGTYKLVCILAFGSSGCILVIWDDYDGDYKFALSSYLFSFSSETEIIKNLGQLEAFGSILISLVL